ncbi:Uncharacterised protein [uncultured archaeon]|nr:Uncharacterised protein [uncultured archaeon]
MPALCGVQLKDGLIILQHLLYHAGLAESAGHGAHAECLVVAIEEGFSLQLVDGLMKPGEGVPEGMVRMLGQKLLVRLGLESSDYSITIFREQAPCFLWLWRVRRTAEVLPVGFASKPAFPPHPICHHYYIRGDRLEVFMDGLQFGEEGAEIFAHDHHRPLRRAKRNMLSENIYFGDRIGRWDQDGHNPDAPILRFAMEWPDRREPRRNGTECGHTDVNH